MSTHIIDQIAAVKFPKERTGYSDDYYMLATLSGDNNCFDCDSGKRARSWNPLHAGEHWKCLARACEYSSSACGGMLRRARGGTTPEGLIKSFRDALDTAPDYDSPQAAFRFEQTAITFNEEEKTGDSKYYYERAVEKRGKPVVRDIYLRGKVEAFEFDFREPRQAAECIDLLPYGSPVWYHLRIHGDGEV